MVRERKEKKEKDKTQITTFTIYRRQYNKIIELVEDGEFLSNADLVRHALDVFFAHPYWEDKVEETIKNIRKKVKKEVLEEYYNKKVIRVMDTNEKR